MSSCGQEDRVLLILYVASYNKLEQLQMQVLLNCHLAAFLYSLQYWNTKKVAKWQFNNTCMCNCSSLL